MHIIERRLYNYREYYYEVLLWYIATYMYYMYGYDIITDIARYKLVQKLITKYVFPCLV